ncbi:FAD-dependent oxidoreductase [Paraburkholderia sediminicola]|uniref:FAD-dependent oxidoreductase n=1 Tax=Paraburkholderia sediminicola TaxID=458836 RepID=UPI0038BC4848
MSNNVNVDVLVIGGGPAGIAAAVELRKQGVQRVTIVEREAVLGGVPRHCGHPPFGMREFGRIYSGPVYAERLAALAKEHGVTVRVGTTVTRLESGGRVQLTDIEGRASLTSQRVILATGVRESPRSARLVSGDRPVGVINTGALQSFVYLRESMPFRRPLIVGTELVAISAVLTCLKAGIRPVGIVEAGTRPTTRRAFTLLPRLFGIALWYETELNHIEGNGRVEGVRLRGPDGAVRRVDCDGVLFTGKFTPEAALVRGSHLLLDAGTGGPVVDQYGRCSDPSYFAAGNLLRPLETAGWSFREGTRIGRSVAADLRGRMPEAIASVSVERAEGIKLVMPQRLVVPLPPDAPPAPEGLEHLQVRVARQIDGTLEVTADGRVLWERRVSALPERRLLIPLKQLDIPATSGTLRVAIRPSA